MDATRFALEHALGIVLSNAWDGRSMSSHVAYELLNFERRVTSLLRVGETGSGEPAGAQQVVADLLCSWLRRLPGARTDLLRAVSSPDPTPEHGLRPHELNAARTLWRSLLREGSPAS